MKERIDIVVSENELDRNDERREFIRKAHALEPTERIPILINTNQITALAARGRKYADYTRSPRDNMREQILNIKWRAETIRDDQPIPEDSITVQPTYGCVRGTEFEMKITLQEDQPPKAEHPLTDPERMHRLMEIVTESHIRCVEHFDKVVGRPPRKAMNLGSDTAEMISVEMFKEFVVPYYNRIYARYPGPRGFHNCGESGHLLDSFRDDLQISYHNGFGACVDPGLVAEKMGGRVTLRGGPDPVLLRYATPDEVAAEAARYAKILGKYPGFIMSVGGGSAAGTPVESFEALVRGTEAA